MAWVSLLCLAVAAAMAGPVPASVLRLRRLGLLGPASVAQAWAAALGRRPRWSRSAIVVAAGAGAAVGVAGTALVVGRSGAPLLPALSFAVMGAVAGRVVCTEAAARAADRETAALGVALTCLADELRAGQRPTDALAAAAVGAAHTRITTVFADAASAAMLGGDVPASLREHVGESPAAVRHGIDVLAASWMVSERSGAQLADVLDSAAADLRAQLELRQQVVAQLAGPRATALLLAGLPAIGVMLAVTAGAKPLEVLFGTPAGQIALLAGVGLQAAGTFWSQAILRSAAES